MAEFVTPKVYLVGYTTPDYVGISQFLKDTGNVAFSELMDDEDHLDGEMLVSLFAKLCYDSLSVGHNDNITKIRGISDNIIGTFDSGHGSVFEHISLNFIATGVSRVFTHELVRHRVGAAYSQESGRYVRKQTLDFVVPPELQEHSKTIKTLLETIESCGDFLKHKLGIANIKDMALKKKLTSAIRRIFPNGQGNKIGFTMNVRTLRNVIEMRTSRHAEWEIRYVMNQVASIVNDKWPLMLYGGVCEEVDGQLEWRNLAI